MIYAVHVLDSKFVKIGFTKSTNIHERIAALQTGCPYEINLLFAVEGTIMQEQTLHKALFDALTRIRIPMPPNEWYAGRGHFMQSFLDELQFGVNNAIAFCDSYNQNVKQPRKGETSVEPNVKWPTK